jgi:hypothetical protein
MKIIIKGTGWQFPAEYYPDGHESKKSTDESIVSMVYGAVRKCLNDAGERISDVDAIVTASVDLFDGKTASSIYITEVVGAVMKPETRIAGDGLFALVHAAMTILSGQYNKVLVVAHSKASEANLDKISNWTFDPVFQQPLGLTDSIALGLQAQAFLRRCPNSVGDEKFRAELVAQLSNRDTNPIKNSSISGALDTKTVLESAVVFSPLHELEINVPGDGAAAVLLEGGKTGGTELQGFGYCLDRHYLGDRDLSRSETLAKAVERACLMAKINQIRDEVDRCYWSLRSSVQMPLWAESAGIWSFKEGLRALLLKGNGCTCERSVEHPGFNAWNNLAPVTMGLQRLICAVRDSKNQLNSGSALVHGCHGPAGQSQAVCLLK